MNAATIEPGLCQCGCGQKTRLATDSGDGYTKGQPRRFVGRHHARPGAAAASWKGGRTMHSGGYVLVSAPGHPRARKSPGHYVREHILIAERALGHFLEKKHPVHHVDEDRANNANSNLVVCESKSYHMLLHQRARALAACGDASALRCGYCHGYDRQEEMTVCGGRGYHRSCRNAYLCESKKSAREALAT